MSCILVCVHCNKRFGRFFLAAAGFVDNVYDKDGNGQSEQCFACRDAYGASMTQSLKLELKECKEKGLCPVHDVGMSWHRCRCARPHNSS